VLRPIGIFCRKIDLITEDDQGLSRLPRTHMNAIGCPDTLAIMLQRAKEQCRRSTAAEVERNELRFRHAPQAGSDCHCFATARRTTQECMPALSEEAAQKILVSLCLCSWNKHVSARHPCRFHLCCWDTIFHARPVAVAHEHLNMKAKVKKR